jgi:hypothetical protein
MRSSGGGGCQTLVGKVQFRLFFSFFPFCRKLPQKYLQEEEEEEKKVV